MYRFYSSSLAGAREQRLQLDGEVAVSGRRRRGGRRGRHRRRRVRHAADDQPPDDVLLPPRGRPAVRHEPERRVQETGGPDVLTAAGKNKKKETLMGAICYGQTGEEAPK